MKQFTKPVIYKIFGTLFLAFFLQAVASAQENLESNITATTIGRYTWYTQPWAIVTGIALVLIIIVALVPSGAPERNNSAKKISY